MNPFKNNTTRPLFFPPKIDFGVSVGSNITLKELRLPLGTKQTQFIIICGPMFSGKSELLTESYIHYMHRAKQLSLKPNEPETNALAEGRFVVSIIDHEQGSYSIRCALSDDEIDKKNNPNAPIHQMEFLHFVVPKGATHGHPDKRKMIWSRNGCRIPAMEMDRDELIEHLKQLLVGFNGVWSKIPAINFASYTRKSYTLVIDEFHLFQKNSSNYEDSSHTLVDLLKKLSIKGARVVISTLNTNYKHEIWDLTSKVLPLASRLINKYSTCSDCGKEGARYHIRNIESNLLIMEDETLYTVVCYECWFARISMSSK